MEQAPKERVPAFRVTTYQSDSDDDNNRFAIACKAELVSEISSEEAAIHFAAIIRTLFTSAREMGESVGFDIEADLLSYINSGYLRPVGKSVTVTVNESGEKTIHTKDHGAPGKAEGS